MKWFSKFINAIKNCFKKPSGGITINPASPSSPSVGNGNKLVVFLANGHSSTGADKGAWGNGTNEVEYNTFVMNYVHNKDSRIGIAFGSSSIDAVRKAKAMGATFIIQMHLNFFERMAFGCEVLAIDGDTRSYAYAEKFALEYTTRFNRVMRRQYDKGKKLIKLTDRGSASLRAAGCATILVEPFFINNPHDFVPKEEYAEFVLEYCRGLLK